jgi:hypothetical protein
MEILSTQARMAGVILFVLLFLYTLFLLRSNRLSPQHATSWIIAELVMLILIISDAASLLIVRLIGAENTLSVIILLGTIWGVLLMLDLLVRISELNAKLRSVNQEVALLRERFEKVEEVFLNTPEHKS